MKISTVKKYAEIFIYFFQKSKALFSHGLLSKVIDIFGSDTMKIIAVSII